jgi:DNA-binding MarR family transcriptional regulator
MTETVTFWIGVLGTRITARFAIQLDAHGVKPKEVGLLVLLDRSSAMSQQELAHALQVAPSLVVAMTDHLEDLDAVRRERDPADRRRQNVAITRRGRTLLAECAAIAAAIDAEISADLAPRQRATLHKLLLAVANTDPALPGLGGTTHRTGR